MSLESTIEKLVDSKIEKAMQGGPQTVLAEYKGTDSQGKGWVVIAGSTESTPITRATVEAAPGDTVSVTIGDGKCVMDANISNPSAGVAGVRKAEMTAEQAQDDATKAIAFSQQASTAASSAQASAQSAANAAGDAQATANAVHGMAEQAQADAATARTAAESAQSQAAAASSAASAAASAAAVADGKAVAAGQAAEQANSLASAAGRSLSDVERIVGTLNWIAEHGEYVNQAGQTFDASKVYYTRSGTAPNYVYTVVPEPVAEDIADYYLLRVDESVQNYIASHLWMDDFGLNLAVDGANGYRVHQGVVGYRLTSDTALVSGKAYYTRSGSGTEQSPYVYTRVASPVVADIATYYENYPLGTYIIDNSDAVVASFGSDGWQVGLDDESHMVGDYHSLQLIDKEGETYFHVSDLRDKTGYAEIAESFTGDGSTREFMVSFTADDVVSVTIDGIATSDFTLRLEQFFAFATAPANGSAIEITYKTQSGLVKAFTIGQRYSGSRIGGLSVAEGYNTKASADYSHAEGYYTTARGSCAHAEGSNTIAGGGSAHAEGYHTTASGAMSHAEGHDAAASGEVSHAEGYDTIASGPMSHAEGYGSVATAYGAHAEGGWRGFVFDGSSYYLKSIQGGSAYAPGSHAQNTATIAASSHQTALGRYNVEDANGIYAVIIGNGTSDSARSNALTVDWDGVVEGKAFKGSGFTWGQLAARYTWGDLAPGSGGGGAHTYMPVVEVATTAEAEAITDIPRPFLAYVTGDGGLYRVS